MNVHGMEDKRWERVLLCKDSYSDNHIFKNEELNGLCRGKFSPMNIEILEVFGRVVTVSLMRTELLLDINLLFGVRSAAQVFIEDIRLRQQSVIFI